MYVCVYPNSVLHHHTQGLVFPVELSVGSECFSAIGFQHLRMNICMFEDIVRSRILYALYVCMYVIRKYHS